MLPISLQDAITILKQNQVNNTLPEDDSAIKVIFSITKKQFHSLANDQQDVIKKFYKASSKSDLSTRPDLAKLFLSFKKALSTDDIVEKFNTELASAFSFLRDADLFKAAASKKFIEATDRELASRLNRKKPVFSLGYEKNDHGKKALLSLLSKHGDKVHNLSLDEMKNLSADDIESFINLCPSLTFLSLKDCELKLNKEQLISFLSKHGDKIHNLSLDEGHDLSADDIQSIMNLCPSLTFLSLKNCKLKFDKETLLSLLLKHGDKIHKLSLDEMKNLIANDMQSITNLCPSLTFLSLKDCKLKFDKEQLASFLSKHGDKIHKLSLDEKPDLSADDIQNFISLCPNLTDLSLKGCKLHSDMATCIIKALSEKTKITHLDLSNNSINVIPPEIGTLSHLRRLDLSRNHIATIPSELGNLSHLQMLNLSRNFEIKVIPGEIGNLSELRTLDLRYNKITAIPSEIENLSQLQRLDLTHNNITAISREIGNLLKLRMLNLRNNNITAIAPEIGNLLKLRMLDLRNNNITGIAPEIGSLSELRILYLTHNKIPAIPPEIGHLSQLRMLDLRNNNITGIPREIGSLSQLRRLDLMDNKITAIPPEIGHLLQLRNLSLGQNSITVIPREIGNLSQLRTLGLAFNAIKTIPREIEKLQQLRKLFLRLNKLEIKNINIIKNASIIQKLYIAINPSYAHIFLENQLKELLPNCLVVVAGK
jgi:Leucine-rich repeat (LRR) protein